MSDYNRSISSQLAKTYCPKYASVYLCLSQLSLSLVSISVGNWYCRVGKCSFLFSSYLLYIYNIGNSFVFAVKHISSLLTLLVFDRQKHF